MCLRRSINIIRQTSFALTLSAYLLLLPAEAFSIQDAATVRPSSPAATQQRQTGKQSRLAVFDEVWETIDARYYDASLRGVDWPSLRAKFRPLAAEARTQEEFYAVLRHMIAALRDPHTRVFAPGESADWRTPRFIAVGLSVRELAGELVVVRVERGSEGARAGVRAGDTVTSVGGEAVSQILARRLGEQTIGVEKTTETARLVAVSKLFEGPGDTSVPVVFRSHDGRERSVLLKRQIRTRPPELHTRRIDGHFHLIQFNIFTPEIAAQLARALNNELRDARGIILDLRENGGGEAEAMTDIASIFLGAGESLGQFTNRAGRVEFEPHTRSAMLSSADALPRARAPLVVLTSGRTASASEVFVAALRDGGRAALLGETTCGCVLGIRRRHTLTDGGTLDISEMDFHTARGLRLEGAGISPDERITPTRQDILAGRDRAIERAIEILKATGKQAKF